MMTSCNDDFIEDNQVSDLDNKTSARTFAADSVMLQNPYAIAVMERALESIRSSGGDHSGIAANFRIKPSHKYIKFKPRNQRDEDLLKDDTLLHIFDYRLDCEYSEKYLANRKIPSDSIPDYYTAVRIDQNLPNVP